jgi:rhamnosyl/mannosyltransferase
MAAGVASVLPVAWRIHQMIRGNGVTIVHSNGNKAHLLSAMASISTNARLVWHVRDFLPNGLFERWLVGLANHRADAVIANSDAVAKHLRQLGARTELVHSIPNGIDCGRFSPIGPMAPVRRELGWPESCRIVGMIGVLAPWKGHRIFLHAAKRILEQYPDVRHVVVGDEIYQTDGHAGFREELIRLAKELGIEHAVRFIGYRDDIPALLRALDVVVHASVEPEPFGRVIAEAMACARPVVATDGGGVPEITGPSGKAALLVPRGDVSGLAAAVTDLLKNPATGIALGTAGRLRITRGFEIRRQVQAVQDVYAQLTMPGRLRVIHAGKFYSPVEGGMETVLEQLCTHSAARWEVRAVVANNARTTRRELLDGVEVVRVATVGRVASVPITPSLPFHLRKHRYDCVVLHEPNPIAAAALALLMPARHLVIWHHSDLVRPWWAPRAYRPLQRMLYRRASCVIVSSQRLADHSRVVRLARRVVVIPFGIRLDKYLNSDPCDSSKSEALRAQHSPPIALCVGRLVYYKGVDVLIKAMKMCPGTLLVIGTGPMEHKLRQLAEQLGIGSRVKFMGRVSSEELVDFYRAADLFVLPSTQPTEAFGLVQIEAMACGLPVVSTDLPTGVPWVNQNGITGLVVPPGDPDALAAAISRLLDDQALRTQMGEAGRRRAAEQFSGERMARDFIAAIEAVVAS